MSSGPPDPPSMAGQKRALEALRAKLTKAIEKQATATKDFAKIQEDPSSKDVQKEAARKAVNDVAKEIGEITKSITALETKSSPKIKGADLKDAPGRVNNFGLHVGTLFENAKPMVGTYPKPKEEDVDLRLPFGLDSLLKRKFPCDKNISESGIKTAQEIIGDGDRVSELDPNIICSLGQEPDKCKTDAGVILNSQCPAHRIVVSKSLEGLGESIKRDIEEAKAESLKKVSDLHASLVPKVRVETPTPKQKKQKKQLTPNPKPTPKNPNIEVFDDEPDDWLGTDDYLTFRFNSDRNQLFIEYYNGIKWYRIYGDRPEDIIELFLTLPQNIDPTYLVFQLDTATGQLFAVDPNDGENIYGTGPEEIVSQFNLKHGIGSGLPLGTPTPLTPTPLTPSTPLTPTPLTPTPPPPPPKAFFDRSNPKPFIDYITYLLNDALVASEDGKNYSSKITVKKIRKGFFGSDFEKNQALSAMYIVIANKFNLLDEAFSNSVSGNDAIDKAFTLAHNNIKEAEKFARIVIEKGTPGTVSPAISYARKADESIKALIGVINKNIPKSTPLTPTTAAAAAAAAAEAEAERAAAAKRELEVEEALEAERAAIRAAEARTEAARRVAEAKAAKADAEAKAAEAERKAAAPPDLGSLIDKFKEHIEPIIQDNRKFKKELSVDIKDYRKFIRDSTNKYNATIKKFFNDLLIDDITKYGKNSDKVKNLIKSYQPYKDILEDRGAEDDSVMMSISKYNEITKLLETLKNDLIEARNKIIAQPRTFRNYSRGVPI